jgi:hypothetical protein
MWRVMQETSKEKKKKFMNNQIPSTNIQIITNISITKL